MTAGKAKRVRQYASGVILMFFGLGLFLATVGFAYWRYSEGWDSRQAMLLALLKYGDVGIVFAVVLSCGAVLVSRSLGQE